MLKPENKVDNGNLNVVVNALVKAGATRVVKVGGVVRDELLNVESKDIDIEVYGLDFDQIKKVLIEFGNVDLVGKSFGILKFRMDGLEYDFSLPRTESKQGRGHCGFKVTPNKFLSYEEASSRRDFTINSMGIDMVTGQLLDPHKGYLDLNNRILRATSPAFKDDPLRVLRGLQLSARFNLSVDLYTAKLCEELIKEYKDLSVERVQTEWFKWAIKGKVPSAGLNFLKETGWSKLYPALHNMIGCLQGPVFHQEGDAWVHTTMVCDEAAKIADRENLNEEEGLVLLFSALLHDVGKPGTSVGVYPHITSNGHPEYGEPIAESFLWSIGAPKWLVDRVKPLVRNHMRYLNCKTEKAVRKLAVDMGTSNIYELSLLIEADHRGRIPSHGLPDKAVEMLRISRQEKVEKQKQKKIIEGRHLQELGLTPSPLYGKIIADAYTAQLNGIFTELDGALKWLDDSLLKYN